LEPGTGDTLIKFHTTRFIEMPIYRPSELHQFLNELGVSPKKGLSQNFLIDGNIIRKIVESAQIKSDDLVLEIGPGPGCLSEEVLNKDVHLLAVEKDPIMAKALERLKPQQGKLEIFCDDILEFPIEQKLAASLKPNQKAILIGNLPYHLTTPILVKLVGLHRIVSKVVIMVQEEVARRFTAKPGGKDYGSITVFLNYFSTPHYAFKVSKNCFYPVPKVDSAVVILDLHEPPKISDEKAFFEMTRTAFRQRRKMLRVSLKELYSSQAVTEALEKIGRDGQSRPEQLSLEDFMRLLEVLHNS
jgi:16S rRNA (adenine1518-N6/adenine1519-N6)-dimethyltransferase